MLYFVKHYFHAFAIYLHVGYNHRMKPETIAKALKHATDAQLASEKGIRDQAKRKTRSGGRPRKIVHVTDITINSKDACVQADCSCGWAMRFAPNSVLSQDLAEQAASDHCIVYNLPNR